MTPWSWNGEVGKDLHCALQHIARELKPESYLEIGVDGGDSLSVVLSAAKPHPSRIVLCDMWKYKIHPWLLDHKHIDLVLDDCRIDRERVRVRFVDGDSKIMVPALSETFDLVTVDGDHSAEGAAADLKNAWPLVNPGGVLVFDDIDHLEYPWLRGVFDTWFASVNDAEIIPQDGTAATTIAVTRF